MFETAVGNFATVNLFDRWWIEENFHGGKLARSSFCLEKYLEGTARPFDRGCKYLPRREFPLAREREREGSTGKARVFELFLSYLRALTREHVATPSDYRFITEGGLS